MHHDLVGVLGCVVCVSFAPVITNSVCKDITVLVESCSGNGTSNRWIALESVLGYSIPEVECTVGASSAESTVLWVEGDGVDRVDIGDVVLGWVAMALEGEVRAGEFMLADVTLLILVTVSYLESFSSTY